MGNAQRIYKLFEYCRKWLTLKIAVVMLSTFCASISDAANLPSSQPRIVLQPCEAGGAYGAYPDSFRCGTFEVYENQTTNKGRKISLFVVVAPTQNEGGATKPPIFVLAGGPGDAASDSAALVVPFLANISDSRDIVFLDQRGTGKSHPLFCERVGPEKSLQRHMAYLLRVDEDVEPCIKELEQKADLTQYNTTHSAADYNDVREALGYEKFALFGGSYGTRLAQEIIRRYPEHTDIALLGGIAPPSMNIPAGFARSFQDALDELFERCADNALCNERYPNLESDFAAIIKQSRKDGVTAKVVHPEYKDLQAVHLTYGEFAMGLRFLAYHATAMTRLPAQIKDAAKGNFSPVVQVISNLYYDLHNNFYSGLNNSIVCAEDIPYIDLEAERKSAAGTVLGMYRVNQQIATCAMWPRGEIPADFHDPVVSDVPVLIFSGAVDPVTPPEHGDLISRTLSHSLHAVFAYRSHDIFGDPEALACFQKIASAFFASSSLDGIDVTCASKLAPLPDPFDALESEQ